MNESKEKQIRQISVFFLSLYNLLSLIHPLIWQVQVSRQSVWAFISYLFFDVLPAY